MSAPPNSPAPQSLGPYLLLERLGEGGMGEVFKARHARLDRVVAVKVIRTDHLRTRNAVRRFVRELRAVARLDHPLIVRAFDAGSDGDRHYLAMEYVEGDDLARFVDSNGPLPVHEACRVAFQVALALQHLYECGITHRDLKPTNLLRVRATGQVKLLDLGLARVAPGSRDTGDSGTMTQVGTVLGTPDYMAPEQALDSTRTDIRSDLYSLGCTFFFLLTGRPPFPGGSGVAKMIRHHDEVPPSVADLRPGVPHEVAAVVARLLAKRPEDRFQTPAALSQAILSLGTVPNVPAPAPAEAVPAATGVLEGSPEGWRTELSSVLNEDSAQFSAPARLAPPLPSGARRAGVFVGIGVLAVVAVLAAALALGKKGKVSPGDAPDPDTAARAAADAAARAEAFADYRQGLGTSRAVDAAERLRKLPSPLDEIRRPRSEGPALTLGQPGAFHVGAAYHLAVTRDGRTVVSGGWDRTVRVWDGATLKQRQVLAGHRDPVHSVAVSPDGKRVLGASWFEAWHGGYGGYERAVRVWDAESGEVRLHHDNDNSGWALSGAFAAGGHVLIGKYESLEMWDAEGGKRVWAATDPGMDWQGATVLSADGSHVFTGGNYKNQVRVWERETGKLVHRLDGHYGAVSRLAANPDNTRLASIGQDDKVRVWDYKSGKPLGTVSFPDSRPRGVAWSADGSELVAAMSDGSVRWIDPAGGKELRRGTGHLGPATAVAVGGDVVFTSGEDGTVRKWDARSGAELLPARPAYPGVRLTFADNDRELRVFPRYGKPVTYHLPDGTRSDGNWNGADVYPLSLSADGGVALGWTQEGKPVVGDLVRGSVVPCDSRPDVRKGTLALGPDGKRVLAAGGNVEWMDLQTGDVIHRLTGWEGEPAAVAVSADGRLGAMVVKAGAVTVWNLQDGTVMRTASLPKGDSRRLLLFGADGSRLFAFGPDETAWELETTGTAEPVSWQPHDAAIRCAAVAPDDKRVATATTDGEIAIRTFGMTRPRLVKAAQPVTALAFSVDSRLLAAALADGTVALYRVGP